MTKSPIERFEQFFEKAKPNQCWLWRGSLRGKGYGGFRLNGKMRIASRISYEFYNGELVPGKVVCHSCNTPACVNPNHLYQGTYSENTQQCLAEDRFTPLQGELNGFSVLTSEQVLAIRKDPRAQRKIAKDFNISQLHVSRIKRKLAWKHLEEEL